MIGWDGSCANAALQADVSNTVVHHNRGTANGLRAFVPRLLAQGEPAHVVNTSSMLGLSSAPLTGIYGASKQAVLALTEALRFDLMLVGSDIGVSVLCPGPVRTNVTEEPGRNTPRQQAPVPEAVALPPVRP